MELLHNDYSIRVAKQQLYIAKMDTAELVNMSAAHCLADWRTK